MNSVLTPMQRQYHSLKAQHQDSILLFRLGDFYEMFYQDAEIASQILGITLTARQKGGPNEMPMCGIPYHSADNYIQKLIDHGHKVAICEQISDPKIPGLVERAVVQIISPGTQIQNPDDYNPNYLVAVVKQNQQYGLAFSDLSTGKFQATQINNTSDLQDELARLNPRELLLPQGEQLETPVFLSPYRSYWPLPTEAAQILQDFFQIPNLKIFYLENEELAVKAAAMLLQYLLDTQKGQKIAITKLEKYDLSHYLPIDATSLVNLEILQNAQNNSKKGSLLSIFQNTQTSAGSRLMREYLVHPCRQINEIQNRLDQVEKLVKNPAERQELRSLLTQTRDLEKILSKIANGKANPKDLIAIQESLAIIPKIQKILDSITLSL